MNITEFLLARIAEDELRANYYGPLAMGTARVLAECAAKRAIIDLWELHRSNRDARRSPSARAAEDERAAQDRLRAEARARVAEDVVLALAAVYASHPDYDPAWSPNAR